MKFTPDPLTTRLETPQMATITEFQKDRERIRNMNDSELADNQTKLRQLATKTNNDRKKQSIEILLTWIAVELSRRTA